MMSVHARPNRKGIAMKIAVLAASSTAAVVAITLLEVASFNSAAEAKPGRSGGQVRAAPSRSAPRVQVQRNVVKKNTVVLQKKVVPKTTTPGNFKQAVPLVKTGKGLVPTNLGKVGPLGKGPTQVMLGKGVGKNFGPVNLKTLPKFKPVVNAGVLKGRVGVPLNIKPKLSLIKGPQLVMRPRFAPFLQRHWKHAFFWVAIAGIGYVTIPELYYDRFYSYISVDDPDYDAAIALLSLAAVEDDDEIVRVPMPTGASYRYTAKAPPQPEARKACALEPFVERKWNSSYVYVQVPEVGNVTVPENDYDKFYGFVSAEPPNYPTACAVLTEAAAADTVIAGVQMAPGAENN